MDFLYDVTMYHLVYALKQVEMDTSLKWNMHHVQ